VDLDALSGELSGDESEGEVAAQRRALAALQAGRAKALAQGGGSGKVQEGGRRCQHLQPGASCSAPDAGRWRACTRRQPADWQGACWAPSLL
jgi:hypothetical protein